MPRPDKRGLRNRDIMLANVECKYGSIAPNQGFSLFQRYSEEVYGIHNKSIGHISAEQAKEILDEGHLMIVDMGCENNPNGVPFCKAKGVPPRCCHGHTVLLYKYDDEYFYVKDSAPSDGASMCLYPEGPLTVTHHGAMDGRCAQNGKTVTYDNYADAWLRNGWVWDVWADHPAKGPTVVPPSVPEPEAWKKDKQE